MLKRAGKSPMEKIGETLTIEQRDNLITALSLQLAKARKELSDERQTNDALKRNLFDAQNKLEESNKIKVGRPLSSEPHRTVGPDCVCGETANFHRVVATAPNGIPEKLGSCMRATCACLCYRPQKG